jgi:DNA repair protein RecN (Recombination protein N)
LEYAPERLREVESRLETISNLKKKYGDSITKVNEFLLQTERDLLASENSGIKKEELESRKRALRNELGEIAEKISRTRLSVTRTMEDGVKRELRDLGMDQVNFVISIKQTPSSDGLKLSDGGSYLHNLFGIDDVEFLISTNPGEPLLPLSRIASTGEISRIMLAIKSSLSRIDRIPVMVFDEIDIGVGGRTGEIIGKKLWKLAQKRQVICVTHLPQIAVYGDNHYKVFKETSSGRTLSELSELKGEARLKELGMMMTGAKLSALSTQTARELKQSADKWKNQQKLS